MLPRANDDSAARLLLAEHAEECGDVRMARAWRWMSEKAKWPNAFFGWWPSTLPNHYQHIIPIADMEHELFRQLFELGNILDHEAVLADALERGEL